MELLDEVVVAVESLGLVCDLGVVEGALVLLFRPKSEWNII